MDKQRGKILVLGPKRCGKTSISNFISGFEENPNFEVYKPTAGTRILEFERVAKAGKTSINMQVVPLHGGLRIERSASTSLWVISPDQSSSPFPWRDIPPHPFGAHIRAFSSAGRGLGLFGRSEI